MEEEFRLKEGLEIKVKKKKGLLIEDKGNKQPNNKKNLATSSFKQIKFLLQNYEKYDLFISHKKRTKKNFKPPEI